LHEAVLLAAVIGRVRAPSFKKRAKRCDRVIGLARAAKRPDVLQNATFLRADWDVCRRTGRLAGRLRKGMNLARFMQRAGHTHQGMTDAPQT
jgi:hypothetical protein